MLSQETIDVLRSELRQVEGRIGKSEARIAELRDSIKSDKQAAKSLREVLAKFQVQSDSSSPPSAIAAPKARRRDWGAILTEAHHMIGRSQPRTYKEICQQIVGLEDSLQDRNALQQRMKADPRFKQVEPGVVASVHYLGERK